MGHSKALKNVIFQPGDLVQVHATQWVHKFAAAKKLIPMWSIPHHVVTRKLNSYTLKILGRLPLVWNYNSKRLWIFKSREGTKLAMEELSHMETHKAEEIDQEGGTEVDGADNLTTLSSQ